MLHLYGNIMNGIVSIPHAENQYMCREEVRTISMPAVHSNSFFQGNRPTPFDHFLNIHFGLRFLSKLHTMFIDLA